MKNIKLASLLLLLVTVLSGCQAVENKEGFFYSVFVKPMDFILEYLGTNLLAGNYGLAIIVITIGIRLILMPFMLKNYRQQSRMKNKMDAAKPKIDEAQKKMKEAETKEEQMKYQQELMGIYREYGINPLNMGCLPLLIQMPIIMGLYFAILYSPDVKSHAFLWFNLGSQDYIMAAIAGVVYLVQARVSLWTMPEQQQKQMKFFIYLSPIMITFISLNAMAALPVYWSVSGLLLVIQTYIGRKFYSEHAEEA
ncbi:membrane protein insertase YidC [Lysinibacillus alkalisoli]|uniref:Membrane protein insertase YidC n=1 Tax=Lysinibacillus alkalisoli TaxID=1911548 RepID=A0A917G6C8_9BACI|nr:membrane protein insertase YidC [Lysinibacillus alkalisoli]GGG25060.1 membrane protein insertase YidC [Lysinibacillus alkalisoli]